MKRLVNGQEVDLEAGRTTTTQVGDRLMVQTADGLFSAVAVRRGDQTLVSFRGRQFTIEPYKSARSAVGQDHSGELISPMPGVVVDVPVQIGQKVEKGDKVVILEAMKTQQSFLAPFKGKIAKLSVCKGEQVVEGIVMAVVEPE